MNWSKNLPTERSSECHYFICPQNKGLLFQLLTLWKFVYVNLFLIYLLLWGTNMLRALSSGSTLFHESIWWHIGKDSTCSAGDSGLIPGLGRSPGEGNGNPLQYSCLGDPLDRGAWWTIVRGVAELDMT